MQTGRSFYDTIPVGADFDHLTEADAYIALPDDWLVAVSDIVNSTVHVANGKFKLVNTVGAAVISAQINGVDLSSSGESSDGGSTVNQFPFVFGGDGAALAIWPEQKKKAAEALAAVRRWAKDEFDLDLRTAIVPVRDIRAAGFDVRVARYAASGTADYAMFAGGGISWAEKQMKAGRYDIPMASMGVFPNLTGLSCRWEQFKTTRGCDFVGCFAAKIRCGPRKTARCFARCCRDH